MTHTPNNPLQIITPTTSKALREVVADMHQTKTNWIPSGIGTRLSWGPPIHDTSKCVSVKGLRGILDYAKDDLTITVESGIPLFELQSALAEENQWLAVDWPWGTNPPNHSGSIGGLVARGLSGGLRNKYLGIRDQIIGIELMRTDGIVAKAGGKVVKNVAGYDLMRLLCGSWGSLALITKLTLRTQPIRPAHCLLQLNGNLRDLEEFRAKLMHANFVPEYCDWIGRSEGEWLIEIGLASISNDAVEDQLQKLKIMANTSNLFAEKKQWKGPLIEHSSEQNSITNNNWLLRLAIPPSKVYKFLSSRELKELNFIHWRICAGIGIGDGWQENVVLAKDTSAQEAIQKLREYLFSIGGQVTILNQPLKADAIIPAWLDASSKLLIESIKKQFDPYNQLAKGRLPGVAAK